MADFALDLEQCIRDAAHGVHATAVLWADHCESVTDKIAYQQKLMEPVLTSIYLRHGFAGALWCALYSGGWPQGWTDGDWYNDYMCPAERVCEWEEMLHHPAVWTRRWPGCACTGNEKLGEVDESVGVPSNVSDHGWHQPEFAASCALCTHLKERLGPAPYSHARLPAPWGPAPQRLAKMAAHYQSRLGNTGYWDRWVGWDMHPFGVWLANSVWPSQKYNPDETIAKIAHYRVDNGEIMHGFLWRSIELLKQDDPHKDPASLGYSSCGTVWRYDGPPGGEAVNRGVCGHAAGHGYYHYYLDVAKAIQACWRTGEQGGQHQEFGEWWRQTCEGGAFHAAFNS